MNHNANLHLLGHYTSFAIVETGMGVVDQLEHGDMILSMEVLVK